MSVKWKEGQKAAIESSGKVLVSASAGSGKTTVMVEKILRYLEDGGDIMRLVVITFTKAGAEEMKEKLLSELYSRIRNGGNVKFLSDAAIKAPFSHISTIDSYCKELCSEYFEDLGIDPQFEVMESIESGILLREAVEDVLSEYLQATDEEFGSLTNIFRENRKLDSLISAIIGMNEFVSVTASPEEAFDIMKKEAVIERDKSKAALYYVSSIRKEINRHISNIESDVNFFSSREDVSAMTDALSRAAGALAPLTYASSLKGIMEALEGTDISLPSIPRKRDLDLELAWYQLKKRGDSVREYIKKVKEELLLSEYGSASTAYQVLMERDSIAARSVLKLIEVTEKARARYISLKRESGKMDFSDLEHNALKVLESEERRERIRNGIDYIFLDEYQDTNYLQEGILNKIARDNIFMVGDVKQSIYKFRFAEPQIFLDKKLSYSSGNEGQSINLNDNFRSAEGILNFVNNVFGEVMTYDFGGIDYKKEAVLIKGKDYKTDDKVPEVTVRFFSKEKDDAETLPSVYSVLDAKRERGEPSKEALYISSKIEELVRTRLVYDKKSDAMRRVEYSDIAIIMRNKRGERIREELIKRKIPFRAPGFEKEGAGEDIQEIINFLKAIENSYSDIPLYAAMRSYFGGFSESEMAKIRRQSSNGSFSECAREFSLAVCELGEKVKGFLSLLKKYRDLSAVVSIQKLVSKIISETGYDGFLISRSEGERIAKVNAFVHWLGKVKEGASLSEFLDNTESAGLPQFEYTGGESAVTFYTIHKSKGLEFPIVFFASAEQGLSTRQEKDKRVFISQSLGAAIKWKSDDERKKGETLSSLAVVRQAINEQKEEQLRLMYVAMTRARYHLFVTGEEQGNAFKGIRDSGEECVSFMELINYAAEKNDKVKRCFDSRVVFNPDISEKKKICTSLETKPLPLHYCYPNESSISVAAKYSVSNLNEFVEEEFHKSAVLAPQTAERGNQYHRFMEYVNLKERDEMSVKKQIEDAYESGILDKTVAFDEKLITEVLQEKVFEEISKGKIYKEMPFMLYVPAKEVTDTDSEDKVLVQGVIDLLSVGEEIVLLDYKVSSLPPEKIKERYKKQLYIYSLAVEKIFKKKPNKCLIFVINQKLTVKL